MPITSRAAFVATATAALAVSAVLPASASAKVVSQDEDAYIQVAPAKGHDKGWGTAWTNQVISERNGTVVSNVATGWMTLYGLADKTRYTLTISKGKCGSNGAAVSSTRRITTDKYGGWHGKYQLSMGTTGTWVVRGGYHLDVAKAGGSTRACGLVSDDPDIGN